MTESSFSKKTAAVKKLFGTAAKLAQKQVELATLNNVTLPKLYHAIGKRIVGLENLPTELEHHRQKIRQLEVVIAATPEEIKSDPGGGFAAKAKQFAQQAAQKAAKATGDAAATAKIQAAYLAIGKEAAQKYGETLVPQDFKADLTNFRERLSQLSEESRALTTSIGSTSRVSSRAIKLAAALTVALLLGFAAVRFSQRRSTYATSEVSVAPGSTITVSDSVDTPTNEVIAASVAVQQPDASADDDPTARPAAKPHALSGDRKLSDEELAEVLREDPDVTHLNLHSCSKLTNKSLSAVARMQHLRVLTLPSNEAITVDGLRLLKGHKFDSLDVPQEICVSVGA